jgi:hypothetical protein
MTVTAEREEAFAVAERAMAEIRLANAIIRDTLPTLAEQAARMCAYVECLDAPEVSR